MPHSTIAYINLDNLAHNYKVISIQAPTHKIMGIVKANSYGHGMIECAKKLEMCGIEYLGVAFISEAIELRKHGIKTKILVLTPPWNDDAAEFCKWNVECVIADEETLGVFSDVALQMDVKLKAHLYIDTGMRRDGIDPTRALEFMKNSQYYTGVEFVGICTHFATSDEPDTRFMLEQLNLFETTLQQLLAHNFTFPFIHAANTAAIFQEYQSICTVIRPGLSLYGISPFSSDKVPIHSESNIAKIQHSSSHLHQLKPVMKVVSRVASIRRIPANSSVSYARRYFSESETTIASISMGYADGFRRSFTNNAECLIQGKRFPVVGTVCMDQFMVNVGNEKILPGDEVVILGIQNGILGENEITVHELAQRAGTIPYEIFTGFSERVERIYISN